jgi:two-component system sensor histidine kinase GlrK
VIRNAGRIGAEPHLVGAGGMVTTLLDLSRLRAGTPLRRQAGTGIDMIIGDAIDDGQEEAQQRRVEIELATVGEGGVGDYDGALCERAVANLIRNAVAVSKSGQWVRIERERRTTDWRGEAGHFVVVRVADEGPGVPDEIRSVIFDAFVTAAVERSPKSIGVGLGLALAREVARVHGGELLLDEVADRPGTTFSLWLPIGAGRANATPLQPPQASMASPTAPAIPPTTEGTPSP